MKTLLALISWAALLSGVSYAHDRPLIGCATSSNGLEFTQEHQNRQVALERVFEDCIRDPRTSRDECNANIVCEGDLNPPPMVVCTSTSRGLSFSDQCRNPGVARSHAINACAANPKTNNTECESHTTCRPAQL